MWRRVTASEPEAPCARLPRSVRGCLNRSPGCDQTAYRRELLPHVHRTERAFPSFPASRLGQITPGVHDIWQRQLFPVLGRTPLLQCDFEHRQEVMDPIVCLRLADPESRAEQRLQWIGVDVDQDKQQPVDITTQDTPTPPTRASLAFAAARRQLSRITIVIGRAIRRAAVGGIRRTTAQWLPGTRADWR